MRLYDALNLGWSGNSADAGAKMVHAAFERYRRWTHGTNSETDEVRFLLAPAEKYAAFAWELKTVVKVKPNQQHEGKLGVVVGYCHAMGCDTWVRVRLSDREESFRWDAIEDAKIPSDLIEIAVGCRDEIKDKVHAKVEEAFA